MDFQLNEEQRIFKKMVHDFADQRLAPLVPTWEKSGEFLDRKIMPLYAGDGSVGHLFARTLWRRGTNGL